VKSIRSLRQSAWFLGCVVALTFGAASASAQPFVQYVPWSTPTYTYTLQSDVVYGQGEINNGGAFKDLELDLYIPDLPPPPAGKHNDVPLMLMIHGGSFLFGSKTDADIVAAAQEYAQRGWLVAAIDYRLIPDNPVPSSRVQALYDYFGGASATPRDRARVAAVDDTLTALDFLHARDDVVKTWTTLYGVSAGSNTALATAYALDDHGIPRPPVRVVVDVAGRFEGAAIGNPFDSPLTTDPVLITITGTDDPLHQYALQTQALAVAAGLPFDFQPIDDEGHIVDMFNNFATTGVILFQRTVDWHHETVFDGLDQGAQPGC